MFGRWTCGPAPRSRLAGDLRRGRCPRAGVAPPCLPRRRSGVPLGGDHLSDRRSAWSGPGDQRHRSPEYGGRSTRVRCPPSSALQFGPHDYAPSRMGKVLLALQQRRLPAVVGGGSDWVDVPDVCAACIGAYRLGPRGENYLIPGHQATVRELATIAESITGVPAPGWTISLWFAPAPGAFAHTVQPGSKESAAPLDRIPVRAALSARGQRREGSAGAGTSFASAR